MWLKLKSLGLSFICIFFVLSCEQEESSDLSESSSRKCSFESDIVYSFDTDPTEDFIGEDVPVTLYISNSNCNGLENGYFGQGEFSYITRVEDVITIGEDAYVTGRFELLDLELSGESFPSQSLTACYIGDRITETITGGSIDSSRNRIDISSRTVIEFDGCDSYNTYTDFYYRETKLEGTYESDCDNGKQTWMGFHKNALIEMTFYYDNSSCSGNHFMYSEKNGPFTLGDNDSLDISYQNFFINLEDSSTASDFNSNSICGKTDWTYGSDIDVSGLSCDLTSIGFSETIVYPSDKERVYDIARKPSDGQMQFGDMTSGDKTSENQRPGDFSSDSFSKVNYVIIPSWTK